MTVLTNLTKCSVRQLTHLGYYNYEQVHFFPMLTFGVPMRILEHPWGSTLSPVTASETQTVKFTLWELPASSALMFIVRSPTEDSTKGTEENQSFRDCVLQPGEESATACGHDGRNGTSDWRTGADHELLALCPNRSLTTTSMGTLIWTWIWFFSSGTGWTTMSSLNSDSGFLVGPFGRSLLSWASGGSL